jgi:hypothetical protein
LFWLDGHYSGGITAKGRTDTPVAEELEHILTHPVMGHVVLIDDARCFVGQDHYPTLDELKEMILNKRPDWVFDVENDIIRVHHRRRSANDIS